MVHEQTIYNLRFKDIIFYFKYPRISCSVFTNQTMVSTQATSSQTTDIQSVSKSNCIIGAVEHVALNSGARFVEQSSVSNSSSSTSETASTIRDTGLSKNISEGENTSAYR